mmetsp:Transcript_110210/g.310852  ORF Transcript_110210/g.310852 Transcript_110210/m.310852 type:complete len:204 (+) Transcript_110210:159-770(+)
MADRTRAARCSRRRGPWFSKRTKQQHGSHTGLHCHRLATAPTGAADLWRRPRCRVRRSRTWVGTQCPTARKPGLPKRRHRPLCTRSQGKTLRAAVPCGPASPSARATKSPRRMRPRKGTGCRGARPSPRLCVPLSGGPRTGPAANGDLYQARPWPWPRRRAAATGTVAPWRVVRAGAASGESRLVRPEAPAMRLARKEQLECA